MEWKTAALLIGVWIDLGSASACGVELCLPLIGVLGGAEALGESDCVELKNFRNALKVK